MNHWQPMIDRCNDMDRRVNDLLAAPAEMNQYIFTVNNIDDLETILFAVRYAANSLGEMKMGASQGTLPNPAMKKTS
jgi:hypothetical protein